MTDDLDLKKLKALAEAARREPDPCRAASERTGPMSDIDEAVKLARRIVADGLAVYQDDVDQLARAVLALAEENERIRSAALNAANLLEARTDKAQRTLGAGFVRREIDAARKGQP